VCLCSAFPGLLHSREIVRRLTLAIEKDVPVTNAWGDIHAATNVPARRSAVAASCQCAGKIYYRFERGSHMVWFLFVHVKHGLYKVCLWFAFCFHISNTVCMQFAYGLLTVYKKLTPPNSKINLSSHLLIRCGRVVPETVTAQPEPASRLTDSSQG
jgi:hypothetical protein